MREVDDIIIDGCGQLSSNPAPDWMAYTSFSLIVSLSLNIGSLSRFMQVEAEGR